MEAIGAIQSIERSENRTIQTIQRILVTMEGYRGETEDTSDVWEMMWAIAHNRGGRINRSNYRLGRGYRVD
jgi:hypothetical protein